MPSKEKFKERIKDEQLGMHRIMNKDLTCHNCIYMYDDTEVFRNISRCTKYDRKPNEVLRGGECSLKVLTSLIER